MTTAPPPDRRPPIPIHHSSIFWYMLIIAFGYWLLVRYLQDPDTSTVLVETMPPWVHWVVGMFYPVVLVHLIPLILGWGVAYSTTLYIIQKLYDLPTREAAREFIPQSFPVIKLPLLITEERLRDREFILLRVGGPGLVGVGTGQVATTEINGRFHRTLSAGRHMLGRFEYVYTLLNLHPQEREAKGAKFITQEGIPIETDIGLIFRLSTGDEPITKSNPFPFDEEAIRKAAYAHTVGADNQVSQWLDIPLGAARGILGGIIAKYSLNELLQPENADYDPHVTIKNELERKLRMSLADQGIELLRVRVGQLKLHEQVTGQFIKYWQAHWQKQSDIIRADGAANALEEVEVARAEAEISMLRAVLEGLQQAEGESDLDSMSEMFALNLLQYLERIAWQSKQVQPLPNQILPQLQELQQLIDPELETGQLKSLPSSE